MHLKINRDRLDDVLGLVKPLVPTRPLNPIEGQVRLLVDDGALVVDATDGRLQLRARVDGADGEGVDLFPAHRLDDFLTYISKGEVTLEVNGDRQAAIYNDASYFTTPLIASQDFPPFPGGDGQTLAQTLLRTNTGALVYALERVQYAVGAEGSREDLRMVQISTADGAVRAYSGFRMQEMPLVGKNGLPAYEAVGDDQSDVILVDYAVQPLVRFLRTVGSPAPVDVEIARIEEDDKPPRFLFVTPRASLAVPAPAIPFVDLSNILRIAAEQAEESGVVSSPTAPLVKAVEAARLASPPDEMSVSIDLTTPIRVHARIDDANTYECRVADSGYAGDEQGRTVTASVDDLLGLLGAWPHESVELLIAPSKYARGQTMPMIQTRHESTGSPGVISQAA